MKNLIKFIEPFKELRENNSYFGYPPVIDEFKIAFFDTELANNNYSEIMDQHNWWQKEIMEEEIPTMTDKDVGVCITAILRRERFHDGLVERFIKNGIMIKLLERLEDLSKR